MANIEMETLTIDGTTYEVVDAKSRKTIETLTKDIEDLKYVAIAIKSFTNNVGTKEIGSKVESITLFWELNKEAATLTIDGVDYTDNSITALVLTDLDISSNKTWTLKVTDEREATASKTTSVSFLNGVYYGASAIPDAYNSDFILSLPKTLTSTWKRSITVNAGTGSYVFYCFPSRFTSSPKFTVNGFSGGFSLVATIQFKNASGYEEEYCIYKSNNLLSGSVPIVIT